MSRPAYFWDDGIPVFLGPFNYFEIVTALAMAEAWLSVALESIHPRPLAILAATISPARLSLRALIYLFLADRSSGIRRVEFRRLALEELGYIVIFRI